MHAVRCGTVQWRQTRFRVQSFVFCWGSKLNGVGRGSNLLVLAFETGRSFFSSDNASLVLIGNGVWEREGWGVGR